MQTKSNYQWYILKTKCGYEKKVSVNLTREGIENYCPFPRCSNSSKFSWKKFSFPLFPTYVFAYTNEAQLAQALKVKGVLNCMYWLNKPALVSSDEIKAIRQLVEDDKPLHLKQIDINFRKVFYITNLQHGREDVWDEMEDQYQLNVILPSLGFCVLKEDK